MSRTPLSLAGFQVILIGRFCVIAEDTFISSRNPEVRVRVNGRFKYVGSVPFTVENSAAGRRYVFVHANSKKQIERMFIIQQEGFLPSADDTYKYPITNPAKLGIWEYQHSVIFDDNSARIHDEPGKEADVTQRFLTTHGYSMESELIMSRFARPADPERKYEIIFFCYENLSSYRRKLADFPEGVNSPEKQEIKRKMDESCRSAFQVSP
jgi:hypothetical protein